MSTYFHSARDRIPDTLVLEHGVVMTIKTGVSLVQGIFEVDPFELPPFLQDCELDRRQMSPVFLHNLWLVHGMFHHAEIGAREQGYNSLGRLKQPRSQSLSE
jgi:hypothetical protein